MESTLEQRNSLTSSPFYSNPSVVLHQRTTSNNSTAQMSQYHSLSHQSSAIPLLQHQQALHHHSLPHPHHSVSSTQAVLLSSPSSPPPHHPPHPHPTTGSLGNTGSSIFSCHRPSDTNSSNSSSSRDEITAAVAAAAAAAAATASSAADRQKVAASLRAAAALGHHLRSGSLPPAMLHHHAATAAPPSSPYAIGALTSMSQAAGVHMNAATAAHFCSSILLDARSHPHSHPMSHPFQHLSHPIPHPQQQHLSILTTKRLMSERSSSLSPSTTDGDNSLTDPILNVSEDVEDRKTPLYSRNLIPTHFPIGLTPTSRLMGAKIERSEAVNHSLHPLASTDALRESISNGQQQQQQHQRQQEQHQQQQAVSGRCKKQRNLSKSVSSSISYPLKCFPDFHSKPLDKDVNLFKRSAFPCAAHTIEHQRKGEKKDA